MAKPIVAIVGRPNVGKSTLFNRLVGGRVAIVDGTPGVTRDRLYRDVEWQNQWMTLVDTGGIDLVEEESTILGQVRAQAAIAMREADLIVFMVDGKTGLTPEDEELAQLLRKTHKPVIVCVNKVDHFVDNYDAVDFYRLGLGDPIAVSSLHGMNTGDLLDAVVDGLPVIVTESNEPDIIRIAVIGRPNVGKSSLVNAVIGQERTIVSDIPGTTRDAIDSAFKANGQNYVIIDTAGLRKRKNVETGPERYSVIRALRAVDRSDVVLMVIDGSSGLIEQDKKIAGYADEAGRGLILVINKWDLVEKDQNTMVHMERHLRQELGFLAYAPILFISALTRQRIGKLPELISFVAEQQNYRVTTSVLNDVISRAAELNPAPTDKGKRMKIFYCTQTGVKPPHFVFFVNDPDLMHFSYLRYLENQIRKSFGFEGTPLRMTVRRRDGENA
ncbi:MAG: ribosome biogenesis GTPase Der [Clostridiales bacterium]|nr:ribosome biogenesis GTPase Der [Clostridiales bacterium]